MSTPIDMVLDGVQWVALPERPHEYDTLPWATHEGVLTIGGASLRVYTLSNGQRIIDADDLAAFFGFGA
jgi:hypothetical protein